VNFINNTKNPQKEEINNTQLIEIQNIKWYEKIFNKIKEWFNHHRWRINGSK
jgi:hypothetical protein